MQVCNVVSCEDPRKSRFLSKGFCGITISRIAIFRVQNSLDFLGLPTALVMNMQPSRGAVRSVFIYSSYRLPPPPPMVVQSVFTSYHSPPPLNGGKSIAMAVGRSGP